MKRVVRGIFTALLIVVAVALVVLCIVMLIARQNNTMLIGKYGLGNVISGSMEPIIPTGSLILVEQTDSQQIKVGDVICFHSDDPEVPDGIPVTHAVVAIETADDGTRIGFVTKGVANEVADFYPARPENVIGKVIWHSFQMGQLAAFARQQWMGMVLVIVLLCNLLMMVVIIGKQVKGSTRAKEK